MKKVLIFLKNNFANINIKTILEIVFSTFNIAIYNLLKYSLFKQLIKIVKKEFLTMLLVKQFF